ncbi:MAG: hypothetical protein WBK77_05545, partial [Alphaproteobacteria bacterium]
DPSTTLGMTAQKIYPPQTPFLCALCVSAVKMGNPLDPLEKTTNFYMVQNNHPLKRQEPDETS